MRSCFVILALSLSLTALAQEPFKTISLSGSDRMLALFEDGSWRWKNADGSYELPTKGERLLLAADGSWTIVKESGVKLPKIDESSSDGQKIDESSSDGQKQSSTAEAESAEAYYTVRSGDTLSRIAARNHTTVDKLCRLNGIKATDILKVGKKIRIN